ncbi:hypothetical protein KFL_000220170 [Klebsormidium nitens]|uniref:Uncharacterized protein n=1 Tax=Klebsormidium nitens TaxID=105231 RepID=A0A1Y1HQW9_KLENI|nr:hypothetical protein KFL_000220170 [Klebsormidium nitens]|eukprot:GAQ78986.1 hypothetical protein KFL_000220170 [Klebsormidium nitens]
MLQNLNFSHFKGTDSTAGTPSTGVADDKLGDGGLVGVVDKALSGGGQGQQGAGTATPVAGTPATGVADDKLGNGGLVGVVDKTLSGGGQGQEGAGTPAAGTPATGVADDKLGNGGLVGVVDKTLSGGGQGQEGGGTPTAAGTPSTGLADDKLGDGGLVGVVDKALNGGGQGQQGADTPAAGTDSSGAADETPGDRGLVGVVDKALSGTNASGGGEQGEQGAGTTAPATGTPTSGVAADKPGDKGVVGVVDKALNGPASTGGGEQGTTTGGTADDKPGDRGVVGVVDKALSGTNSKGGGGEPGQEQGAGTTTPATEVTPGGGTNDKPGDGGVVGAVDKALNGPGSKGGGGEGGGVGTGTPASGVTPGGVTNDKPGDGGVIGAVDKALNGPSSKGGGGEGGGVGTGTPASGVTPGGVADDKPGDAGVVGAVDKALNGPGSKGGGGEGGGVGTGVTPGGGTNGKPGDGGVVGAVDKTLNGPGSKGGGGEEGGVGTGVTPAGGTNDKPGDGGVVGAVDKALNGPGSKGGGGEGGGVGTGVTPSGGTNGKPGDGGVVGAVDKALNGPGSKGGGGEGGGVGTGTPATGRDAGATENGAAAPRAGGTATGSGITTGTSNVPARNTHTGQHDSGGTNVQQNVDININFNPDGSGYFGQPVRTAPTAPVASPALSAGRVKNVEPQTADEAVKFLKHTQGFGEGVLQRPDGTGLAPNTRLEPGKDYIFVPSASPTPTDGGGNGHAGNDSKPSDAARPASPSTNGTGGSEAASGAQARVVRIRNASAGQISEVEPQTARDALQYLKNISGFSSGVLQNKNGTGLAPDTRLDPSQEYVFVPDSATRGHKGSGGTGAGAPQDVSDGSSGGAAGGGSGPGSTATAQVVRIVHSSTGRTSDVEPQTVQDAQEYLRNLPEFGPGVLQRKDGTGLSPGSRLEPGQDYVFVPSRGGSSAKPADDTKPDRGRAGADVQPGTGATSDTDAGRKTGGGGTDAGQTSALITTASGASQPVEPQTVSQALDALKGIRGFGEGVLTAEDGTLLAPETRLQPGGQYTFVPDSPSGAGAGAGENGASIVTGGGNQKRGADRPGPAGGGDRPADTSGDQGPASIQSTGGGYPLKVQPQTVAQALAALKRMPRFGEGTLKAKNGTLLAPDTRLQPGGEHVFVPTASPGTRDGTDGASPETDTSKPVDPGYDRKDGGPDVGGGGGKGSGGKDPIVIQHPSGGSPAKLQPQTVGEALDALKRVDGFGEGRLQKPDGTILARGSPLEPGVVFVPNVTKGKGDTTKNDPRGTDRSPISKGDGQMPDEGVEVGGTKGDKSGANTDPIVIPNPSGDSSAKLQPQTVGEALDALKGVDGFGEGHLQKPDGTILARGSPLDHGAVFVSSAATGKEEPNEKDPVQSPSGNDDGDQKPSGSEKGTGGGKGTGAGEPSGGSQGGAKTDPIVIGNPSGGSPAKLQPQTVGEALDALKGVGGFGEGRLQKPDGTILARSSPLEPGVVFVPNVPKGKTDPPKKDDSSAGQPASREGDGHAPNGTEKGGTAARDASGGGKSGGSKDPIVIQNPRSGGSPAKLQPQTVGEALDALKGVDGFGEGRLQKPDGTILARGSPLEPGAVFVPNVAEEKADPPKKDDSSAGQPASREGDGRGPNGAEKGAGAGDASGGGKNKEPIVIENPSGGLPAKLQPQTVGEALDALKGVDGFGEGRLQKPDGTILARGSPLEPGAVFVPNVAKGEKADPPKKDDSNTGQPASREGDGRGANGAEKGGAGDDSGGGKGSANKDPIVIGNPSGGAPAKLQPQTVGEALDALKGVDGFGEGRLQKPDGTILARGSPLKPGVVFVPNVAEGKDDPPEKDDSGNGRGSGGAEKAQMLLEVPTRSRL